MRFTVEVTGEREAALLITGMGERAANARPAWGAIRPILWAGERKIFARRGAPLGSAWPTLRPGTLRLRRQGEGGGRKTLIRTGRLFGSLTGPGPGAVWRVERDQAIFGTTIFYAKFLRNRRPMVGVPRKERRVIATKMRDWIVDG